MVTVGVFLDKKAQNYWARAHRMSQLKVDFFFQSSVEVSLRFKVFFNTKIFIIKVHISVVLSIVE